ncbi:MAG: hypothetical protein COA78_22435 [Blastopirellula sp.]|nr:MAG: hypothetical protein COA78_22435 [Blastopirellula sp.]
MNPLPENPSKADSLLSTTRVSLLVLTGSLAVFLSLFLFYIVRSHEQENLQSEMERISHQSAVDIQRIIDRHLEVLESIDALYMASKEVERDEFDLFTAGPMKRHQNLHAIYWIPVVLNTESLAHEKSALAEGLENYQIHELSSNGESLKASPREKYHPILYVASHTDERALLGLDLSANRDWESILASSQRLAVATTLDFQGNPGSDSCTVLLPIFKPIPGERAGEYLKGFAAISFHINELIAEPSALFAQQGIHIQLINPSSEKIPPVISAEITELSSSELLYHLKHAESISVANQNWELVFTPTDQYLEGNVYWKSWAVLVGCISAAVLVISLLFSTMGQASRVEEIVRSRTAELARTNVEYEKAIEVAESANKAKGQFLASVSHEIRTPLNAVIGMTELVLDTPLNHEQKEYLTLVHDSGESLLSVINDILDFSKIEAGRLDLEQVPFDHAELLGDTIKSLGFRAQSKVLELLCRISPDIPSKLIGDPGRLRQILVNLIGNAIKFTEKGEIVVEVMLESEDADHVTLHYSVRDTGVGIPQAALKRMFEAFEQVDASTTRKFGGTGLGLAISSRLVEIMGGRIWAESEEGVGSIFHFNAVFEVARQWPSTSISTRASIDQLHDMHVLVVDDNQTNRTILQETMTKWKMRPHGVENAEKALNELLQAEEQGNPYTLLVTDAHMPVMDGFELVRKIQNDPRLSSTIIMMLSSGDTPTEELGIAIYITKPVKQSELLDAILFAVGVSAFRRKPSKEIEFRPSLRPLNILLVEDSEVNQKLALGLLGKYNHKVDVASNGKIAINLWRRGDYDVVLMDIQMSVMDGLEATRQIRRIECSTPHHTPIIAMTAHAMKGTKERCIEAGMDDYVSKPIRRKELFTTIQNILGERYMISDNSPLDPARNEVTPVGTASAEETSVSMVDWSVALENTYDDLDLLKELIQGYLQESIKLLKEMHASIEKRDAVTLRRAAHTMKSQFKIFGVASCEHLAFDIEIMGRDGRVDAEDRVKELEGLVDNLEKEMLDFLAGKTPIKSSGDLS